MFSASKTGAGASGYQISNSLRFQSASSQYLSRTPASAGSQTTWTWSGWVKRAKLNAAQEIFSSGYILNGSTTFCDFVEFNSSDKISFNFGYTGTVFAGAYTTNAVFRDPSAWYHIVIVLDTTNATSSERFKLYINNVLQSLTTTTALAQNALTATNSANVHTIARVVPDAFGGAAWNYFDGYMTELNFVGGTQLTPSSFGQTDATTGQWVAKKYTGTYGTNGFYLPFSNGTSTTTLGADSSGNGNNWTLTNFTRSAGVSDCLMFDVPSGNGGASGTQPSSNYSVGNPINNSASGNITFTRGNLALAIGGVSAQWRSATATMSVSSGKWYWEATVTTSGGNGNSTVGIIADTVNIAGNYFPAGGTLGYAYLNDGNKYNNGAATAYGASWTTNDVIGVAFDAGTGQLTFYKNGVSQGVAYTVSLGNSYYPVFGGAGATVTNYGLNFGQRSFAYTPPSGFKALCTANLPVATIKQGSQQFNTVLYTGDGTNFTTLVTTGFAFGFSWIKNRSVAVSHNLYDVVRNASLESNTTGAEFGQLIVPSGTGFLPSSDSRVNQSGQAFVQWAWNAGSSTVTNTNGTISSQVRANPTAGFSIVTYTGTGANATVGHGLGVAPKMVIVKSRSGSGTSYQWFVWHTNIPNTNILVLNGTNGLIAATDAWNSTSPTSTTISLGTNTAVNGSTSTYVAYCFAEIAGFSKFGLYTGNGSADGPFVFLGFRPKFVMIKRTDSTSNWITLDSARNTYNEANTKLYLNSTSADDNGANAAEDFLSNGFKLRATWVDMNASGATYIYMAFAENPFAQSNAR